MTTFKMLVDFLSANFVGQEWRSYGGSYYDLGREAIRYLSKKLKLDESLSQLKIPDKYNQVAILYRGYSLFVLKITKKVKSTTRDRWTQQNTRTYEIAKVSLDWSAYDEFETIEEIIAAMDNDILRIEHKAQQRDLALGELLEDLELTTEEFNQLVEASYKMRKAAAKELGVHKVREFNNINYM